MVSINQTYNGQSLFNQMIRKLTPVTGKSFSHRTISLLATGMNSVCHKIYWWKPTCQTSGVSKGLNFFFFGIGGDNCYHTVSLNTQLCSWVSVFRPTLSVLHDQESLSQVHFPLGRVRISLVFYPPQKSTLSLIGAAQLTLNYYSHFATYWVDNYEGWLTDHGTQAWTLLIFHFLNLV